MRIVVTGPESSGKTTLAMYIAQKWNLPLVEEYAREYLTPKSGKYTFKDVAYIAQVQRQRELEAAGSNAVVVCDTDLTVIWVWMHVKFGKVPTWIDDAVRNSKGDIYLLCAPDLDWKPDPLRENPHNRFELYSQYIKLLTESKVDYIEIKGVGAKRNKNAIPFIYRYITTFLRSKTPSPCTCKK
jgi:nicotinamide riboside kinase